MTTTTESEIVREPEMIAAEAALMRSAKVVSDALVLQRDPNEMLAEATKAAKALMQVMAQKPDKVVMNGQQYIENEDWQTIGHFYGATAQIESDRYVEFGDVKGWEATAVLVARDGRVLGRASAMCLNDEEKWSSRKKFAWAYVKKSGGHSVEDPGRDEIVWVDRRDGKPGKAPKKERLEIGEERVPLFQLRSMAQTRVSSKVHRLVLAFVPVLAGFSPTPAEELPHVERVPNPDYANGAPASDEGPDLGVDIPEGLVLIQNINRTSTRNPKLFKYTLAVAGGPDWPANQTTVSTVNERLAAVAQQCMDERTPVRLTTNKTQYGYDVASLERVEPVIQLRADESDAAEPVPPLTERHPVLKRPTL